jgi:ABC-2 type transport system ATP-binding protein
MLEIRSLTKRYDGFTAVDNVSFEIRPGEILGYLGPNGAGKSTTVKMLIGLLEPSSGEIHFEGRSILDDMPDFQARLGYVPEEPQLYAHLSGREYLQLAGRLRGVGRRALDEKMDEFLRLFSLWDDQYCAIQSYSKGMRQKIMISAALLHNPQILILDEPLSGLDVNTAMVLKDLMQGLARKGKTIFYSSHVLEVVEKVCSRVLILRKGHVVADDSVSNLRELMHQPSLEGVFASLTEERAPIDVAGRILEVMQA